MGRIKLNMGKLSSFLSQSATEPLMETVQGHLKNYLLEGRGSLKVLILVDWRHLA